MDDNASKPSCPASRPDEAAALVTARICGGQVKIDSQTSEYDEGWAQPNGQVNWEHYYRPVRIERDNSWIPVDTTLSIQPDGSIKPAATAVGLSFSGGGTGSMVTITESGDTMRVGSPLGSLPAPVLAGNTATYPEVLPGVDMQLQADVDGYAEVLVVKDRAAAANPKLATLQFPVATTGLTLSADSGGNLRATDAKGTVKLAGNAPEMWDSSAKTASPAPSPLAQGLLGRSEKLATKVAKSSATNSSVTNSSIAVTPDAAMLDDANTVYPVYIDPGATATRSAWTKVNSNNPTTSYWNSTGTAQVGGTNVSNNKYRSFFDLNVGATPVAGKYIIDADFHITQQYSLYCESHPVELWSTTYAGSATTWNAQPTWSTKQGSVTSLAGCDSSHPGAAISFDVTGHVQAAADGSWSDLTYGLRAPSTDETGLRSYKEFNNNPYVTISYTAYPTITSKGTVPGVACATGSSRPYISTATPTLRVRVTDPEGGSVRPEIEWDTLAGAKIGSAQPLPGAASGSLFGTAVPAGAFTDGTSYSWKARGFDSVAWGPWASPCEFTIDATAPSAPPTVASTVYPAGAWAGAANTAGTFTFGAAGISDVSTYLYGLDSNPPTNTVSPTALGGSASVSLTPTTEGQHTLYVQSVDRAGNESAVTPYSFYAGNGSLTSPPSGSVLASQTSLVSVAQSSATGVTYQWRRGDADTWATVPAADVTTAAGGTAVTWPFAGTSGQFAALNWNIAKTLNDAEAGADALPGPLQIRAQFNNGTVSNGNGVVFDPNKASAQSTEVGPGSVNLVTGNFNIAMSDVSLDSYDSDPALGRSFNSRQAAVFDSTHMFGPGWLSSTVVDAAEAPFTSLFVAGSLVTVGMPDGSTIGFTQKTSTTFTSQVGYEALTLTYTAGQYKLADQEGNVVIFSHATGAQASVYNPTAVTKPGASDSMTVSWQAATVDGVTVTRPTQILAPLPAGVSDCANPVKGCRALTFTYASTTTATATANGDFTGRVKTVSLVAWDPASNAMKTIDVSAYLYDGTGRLAAQWDPRLDNGTAHLWNTYTYNTDGTLAAITPVSQSSDNPSPVPSWQLTYTTVPGDAGAGRLATVSRSALSAGTATTTVVYNVPLTVSAGGPYDMGASATAAWGEYEQPTQATAIFPPTQVPDGNQSNGTLPGSWTKAQIAYMNANGRRVNSVTPGGNIATSWYDARGKTIRELDAPNRVRALSQDEQKTFNMNGAQLANALSSQTIYSADGTRVLSNWSPYHNLTLANGTAVLGRDVTDNQYDQGAPNGTCPCGQVTTTVDSVLYWNGGIPNVGTLVTNADAHTTTTAYDWSLRQPLKVITDPGGLALTTTYTYDPVSGEVAAETAPGGGTTTNTPSTTTTVYYTTAANSTYPACGGHPEWANLVCRTGPGGQPGSGPEVPATVTTYNLYNDPTSVTESTSSGTLRTTSYTYDNAGRQLTQSIVGASGTGAAIPTQRNVYDPTNGNLVHVQSIDTSGNVTAQTTTAYDALDRVTTYTDTDGAQSTRTYDVLGRPVSQADGAQSRTISYDTDGENRGLPTKITDGQAGTISATYTADGKIASEAWPNGILVTYRYESGVLTGKTYTKTNCGQADCTLDDETASIGQGRTIAEVEGSFQVSSYSYDADKRLVNTTSRSLGTCFNRAYGFGSDAAGRASDRTSLTVYGPASDGSCQTTTAQSNTTWTYDTADRVTSTGYTYDSLGRTTTVPAADTQTPAGGNLTATYDVNDLVRTLKQGSNTAATYNLDVDNQRIRSWTDTNGATHTNHYSGTADSPAWTDSGTAGSQRNITGLSGLIAVSSNTSNIAWELTDLRGSIIATVNNNDVGINSSSITDEYGVLNNKDQVGVNRYAWLGGKQRAADNPDGIILMGVRLYNPVTGRFLSVDPVPGGNANPYDYVTGNPVNNNDLDGRRSYKRWTTWHWWGAVMHFTFTKNMTKTFYEDGQSGIIPWMVDLSICGVVTWAFTAGAGVGCGVFMAFHTTWAIHEVNAAHVNDTCFEFEVIFNWTHSQPFTYAFGTRHGRHCVER
ncbi:RHS repeat-associated core domain-containing protein [Actinoplanes subtropicus]|uniref:RHS repeat-associated core domain-containing protein n=1 Tax=Actinoplanes subtropicus TaxID=543632 RepID=UPI00068D9450|nr:RHS repeat-associated core domain-containing protein [Actinoplanes subtropicus]